MLLISAPPPTPPLGFEKVVEPYYVLTDAGAEVVVATVKGGAPSVRGPGRRSTAMRRFQADRAARDAINDTLALQQVYAEDFDGGICLGALDGASEAAAGLALVAALLSAGKPVAIVSSEAGLAPGGTLEGLLIAGDRAQTPAMATRALLAALTSADS